MITSGVQNFLSEGTFIYIYIYIHGPSGKRHLLGNPWRCPFARPRRVIKNYYTRLYYTANIHIGDYTLRHTEIDLSRSRDAVVTFLRVAKIQKKQPSIDRYSL